MKDQPNDLAQRIAQAKQEEAAKALLDNVTEALQPFLENNDPRHMIVALLECVSQLTGMVLADNQLSLADVPLAYGQAASRAMVHAAALRKMRSETESKIEIAREMPQ